MRSATTERTGLGILFDAALLLAPLDRPFGVGPGRLVPQGLAARWR
jgi:hypothetical protein